MATAASVRVAGDEAVAVLEGIGKRYGEAAPPVLEGVSLSLRAGELVAVLGASGAGKTTLLNLLGCLDRPTSGRYSLAGVDATALGHRALAALRARVVGFVFQQFHLVEHLTVRQNLEVRFLYHPDPVPRDLDRKIDEALARLGIDHLADRHPRHLSGGEMQRVGVARALVTGPALILADEPTGNLDVENSRVVMDLLEEAASGGAVVVVATHDPEVAGRCRRRLRIVAGGIRDVE